MERRETAHLVESQRTAREKDWKVWRARGYDENFGELLAANKKGTYLGNVVLK